MQTKRWRKARPIRTLIAQMGLKRQTADPWDRP